MSATLVHMVTRNITLSLPADLIRRAKVYAAAHDTSISAMVADLLGGRVGAATEYDEAWAAEVAVMTHGFGQGFVPVEWGREALHERGA